MGAGDRSFPFTCLSRLSRSGLSGDTTLQRDRHGDYPVLDKRSVLFVPSLVASTAQLRSCELHWAAELFPVCLAPFDFPVQMHFAPDLSAVPKLVVLFALAFAMASASYHFVELPVSRRKRQILDTLKLPTD